MYYFILFSFDVIVVYYVINVVFNNLILTQYMYQISRIHIYQVNNA